MGSLPPYGYKKSPENKHVLAVDEVSARIVRQIFERFKNNESGRSIAEILNRQKEPTPQNYYYQSINKANPYKNNKNTWSSATVLSILRNEVYLGHTVQSKRATKSFKSKDVIFLPEEMWNVVYNTHTSIIDESLWAEVQLILNKNEKIKRTAANEVSLFSGLLYCKDCNSKLIYNLKQHVTMSTEIYRCSNYIQRGKHSCTPHRIKLDHLYYCVLEDIKRNAKLAKEDEEEFLANLHSISLKEQHLEIETAKKQAHKTKARISEIDVIIKKAFEKNATGVLSDSSFSSLVKGYETEKELLERQLTESKEKIFTLKSSRLEVKEEINNLKQYAEITKLDRVLLTGLIKSIHISESKIIDGEKYYDIEIRYKFHNKFTSSENKDFVVKKVVGGE